jgi:hypothetical protein
MPLRCAQSLRRSRVVAMVSVMFGNAMVGPFKPSKEPKCSLAAVLVDHVSLSLLWRVV